MRYLLPALAALLAPAAAHAQAQPQGFASKDLTTIERAVTDALGTGFAVQADPNRLALACMGCAGEPIIGIELGRQTDGTEDRVRSGQTKAADLEKLCQARDPECKLSLLDAAPAVGWVSSWSLGSSAAATAILIKGGDMVTIRSVAQDAATARRNIDKLLPVVRGKLIGG
jgi:hypothetical protein